MASPFRRVTNAHVAAAIESPGSPEIGHRKQSAWSVWVTDRSPRTLPARASGDRCLFGRTLEVSAGGGHCEDTRRMARRDRIPGDREPDPGGGAAAPC